MSRHAAAATGSRAAPPGLPASGSRNRTSLWAACTAALVALGASGLASAASPAMKSTAASAPATGPSAPAATSPVQLQEVTVTGSRIKQTTDFTTPTPTTVIDAQTMHSLGIINVGQALKVTPANVSEFTPATTGSSSFYTGAYIPDLRGLNGFFNTRTLTLIDGNRVVPTNTSGSFDLNFVPQILVQRIDTVTGGASAAYGSGAIAGVINIILNRNLSGGKLDVDEYDTHYNDARDRHVGFAWGHGFFHNRFHFVIGAEWEKQDPARCMQSERPWCVANRGVYNTQYSPTGVAQTTVGSNLRTDVISQYGALGAARYNPYTRSYAATANSPLYQASESGLGLIPYTGNNALYGGAAVAPGGSGLPVNDYTNLITPVTRGVITALFNAKLTSSINLTGQLNWGKVEANNPNPGVNTTSTVLGMDNPFLPAGAAAALTPTSGYFLGKNWNAQIPNSEFNDTTLKRVVLGLNGRVGHSSWTWDGHWEYGLTKNTEGQPTDFHANEAAMALDAIKGPNGQPECRITAALNAHPGDPSAALASMFSPTEPYNAFAAYGGGFSSVSYLLSDLLSQGATLLPNPLTGLNNLQTMALLGQHCVPLDPFGKTQLSPNVVHYITGPLALKLRQTQTVLALNATGNFWHGIGAGPFSMAVGYEWRQEIVHNNFVQCPPGQLSGSAETLCLSRATDFTVQFGDPYGGDMGVNEAYLEFNFPLLKNRPFAHRLDVDVAGRVSSYTNTALYALGIRSGASSTSTFPTWKVSMSYEPVRGIRFRATESRDERAPDARDLYYSQVFVAGSLYGTCFPYTNTSSFEPCDINLVGNVNLKPESANTTTFGIVLTPPQLPGLEFSADWYHIHLINGINGGNIGVSQAQCATGHGAAACPGFQFNQYAYNAAGQPCSRGVSGPLYPGAGADCTGQSTLTGAAAYQQVNSAANILGMTIPAFNGAFYDERGVDFSLNYVWALPDGSTIEARALTTWVGEQVYQNYAGGPILDILGQTGNNSSAFGLGDYQNAPRWRGNLSVTWAKGPWSITPNLTWIGQGTLNNQGLACSAAQLSIKTDPCDWAYHGFAVTGLTAAQAAHEAYMKAEGVTLLPIGIANHVPSYFIVGLNATYNFRNVLQGLQLYTQINNLFNKAPPFTANAVASPINGTTTNPVFFDQLGLAYRVGFRLKF